MATATKPKYLVRVDRQPQDDDELWWYVKAVWGFEIPRTRICPHHQAPFDAFADAYFARSDMSIWKASRGFGGKSMLIALLGLTEMTTLGASVTILGGSGQQSKRVHEAMTQAWDAPYAPRNMLTKEPTMYETVLLNGAKAVALMASQGSVRGPHPQRLRLDECDEMSIDILDASLGQPMSIKDIPSQVVMSSTHQYADGTMTELYRRAQEKGWTCFEWCYRESMQPHGWLNPDEVERAKSRITSLMWQIEYEGQEPYGGARAIMPEAVEAAFCEEWGSYVGDNGEYIEVEPPEGEADGLAPYATGVDWAKEQDWTIITTYRIDGNPWRLVAWERLGRMRWPTMVAALDARLDRYGGMCCHDNTGLGDVIDDYLKHMDQAIGVTLVGRQRQDLFSEYIADLENGVMRGPRIQYAYNEHKYVTMGDLTGSGHPPDTFVAGALARHAAQFVGTGSWSFI